MLGFFSITGTCLCSYTLNISGLLFVLQSESDLLIFFFSHKGTVVPKILKFEPTWESQGDHETVPSPETLPLRQQTLTLHTIKGHPHIFTTVQHKSPGPGAIPPYSKGWCIWKQTETQINIIQTVNTDIMMYPHSGWGGHLYKYGYVMCGKCVYGCLWRPGVRSPAVRSMGSCELPHEGAVNRTRMIQKTSESCSHFSSLREHFLTPIIWACRLTHRYL